MYANLGIPSGHLRIQIRTGKRKIQQMSNFLSQPKDFFVNQDPFWTRSVHSDIYVLISELMHFYLPSLFYLKSLSILSVFKSFENLIFLIHCTKAISNFLSMWPNQFKPYSITISNNKLQYSQLFFLLYED